MSSIGPLFEVWLQSVGVTPETKALIATLRSTIELARRSQLTFLAAAVAYYAFVSVVPALLLSVAVATTLGSEVVAERLLAAAGDLLTPTGQTAIVGAVADAPGAGGATVVGSFVLLWGTLKVFRALDAAFLTVYGDREQASSVDQLLDAAVALGGVGVGLLVMLVVGAVLSVLPIGPTGWLLGLFGLPIVLLVAFLPMYHRLPNPPIGLRAALPGATCAAIGWTALQAGFQLYVSAAAPYQAYGVLGGILLFVTWLYLAAIVVLLGAALNAVVADRAVDGESPAGSAGR